MTVEPAFSAGSVPYRICMQGGQPGISKCLRGAGTKSHLFILCFILFLGGHLNE